MPELCLCLRKLKVSNEVVLAYHELIGLQSTQMTDWLLELQCKLHRQIRGLHGHLWTDVNGTLLNWYSERLQWHRLGRAPDNLTAGILSDSSDDSD